MPDLRQRALVPITPARPDLHRVTMLLCTLGAACAEVPSAVSTGPGTPADPGAQNTVSALPTDAAGAGSIGTNSTETAGTAAGGAPRLSGAAGVGGAQGASVTAAAGGAGAAAQGPTDTSAATAGTAGLSGTTGVDQSQAGAGAGGEPSAGAGTGGATGTTGSPGASRCPDETLLLCEGFEASTLDASRWQPMQAQPSVDDAHAARGERSLHVHTSATSASGIRTSEFFARTNGHYYGRMFVYFDALPTSPQWAHWTIVGANPDSSSSDRSEIRVGGQHDGSIERFGVGTDGGPTGDWTNLDQDPQNMPQAVPLQRWLCVEWLHDWANDVTRFYLDGEEHPSLHTTTATKHGGNGSVPYAIPELSSVWVGFWNYNQGKPVSPDAFDIWLDEIAFDDERIGCDR